MPLGQAVAAGPAIVVEGRVLVEATGAPVMGARVTLDANERRSVMTDRDGRYRFPDVSRTDQTLSVRAIGYIPERREIRPSCTVAVSDERGRVVTPARCTPSPEQLDFRLRPETVY
ncbi:MAG: carboxypeptidase regulatory-like domain-containing protein [Gemmatimonadaceae bacterium]|nr:carboxypeptidase regulatory-like domain-containing protein [Gemmatimonadaceae bacterium]